MNTVEKFHQLVNQLTNETLVLSSMNEILANQNYLDILAMGKAVIPLILIDMKLSPKWWCHALMTLTGADPVDRKNAGDLHKINEDWFLWARKNGYQI